MEHIEMVLVGGPSDGRRIRMTHLDERIRIADPIQESATWDPTADFRFPESLYVLTSLRFDDLPIQIYAHNGLTMADAWHRLVHRYPNPQDETPRAHTRHSTLGI